MQVRARIAAVSSLVAVALTAAAVASGSANTAFATSANSSESPKASNPTVHHFAPLMVSSVFSTAI